MEFRIHMAERTAILNTLRRLGTGKYVKGMPPAPRIVLRGKVDYEALRRCTDYAGLLEACRQTIYYPALLHLRPAEGRGLPDYSVAETLLHSAYFAHMFSLAQRRCGSAQRELIQRALGQQADLLNILHILRLKTYFPDLPPETCLTMLFPFRMALRPELLTALCAARSPEEVFDLLADTPYARRFSGGSAAQAEEDCRKTLYAFYKRLLITAPPSVCTAMAYLELKETELAALVNVIESVKYGVPCDAGLIALVGA